MNEFINANLYPGATDNETITNAIAAAKKNGVNRVVIPRVCERTGKDYWTVEDTVKLPDEIELIIDDARLVLADGKYINMFANETARTEKCRHIASRQHGITIRGRGRATLDGGSYNGLHERNCAKDGLPHISYNTTLLFANVRDLLIENISVVNQRWWGITNIAVTDSVFRNINFEADFSRVDENGVHHADELPKNYNEVYIKNADGIDLRVGCHHILIENISGFTEDDSVALTALGGFESRYGLMLEDENADNDIHDVLIKNVSTNAYCSNVRLLNDNGYKLYNITIDGVTSHCPREAYRNLYTVRIGDTAYANTPSNLGDTHHITVKNVVSTARYGVALCKGLVDSSFTNITVKEGGTYAFGVTKDRGGYAEVMNVRVKNVLLEGSAEAFDIGALRGELITEE